MKKLALSSALKTPTASRVGTGAYYQFPSLATQSKRNLRTLDFRYEGSGANQKPRRSMHSRSLSQSDTDVL